MLFFNGVLEEWLKDVQHQDPVAERYFEERSHLTPNSARSHAKAFRSVSVQIGKDMPIRAFQTDSVASWNADGMDTLALWLTKRCGKQSKSLSSCKYVLYSRRYTAHCGLLQPPSVC
ncbi:hypothetical protein J6590_079626 [Homalodisca vitripennis]|nr:hypothetical protein J6590_079626 [Homalodisca vitripennis]